MSIQSHTIAFVQCDVCGRHAPVATTKALAYDHAEEQEWSTTRHGRGRDICDECVEKESS